MLRRDFRASSFAVVLRSVACLHQWAEVGRSLRRERAKNHHHHPSCFPQADDARASVRTCEGGHAQCCKRIGSRSKAAVTVTTVLAA